MFLHLALANSVINPVWVSALGFVGGVISALLGIGGGFFLVPLLFLMGVPENMAVGSVTNQIIASSLTGTIRHTSNKNIDYPMAGLLVFGSLIGVGIGLYLFHLFTQRHILGIVVSLSYVGLMLFITVPSSLYMLVSSIRDKVPGKVPKRVKRNLILRLPLWRKQFHSLGIYTSGVTPVGLGILAGICNALLGLGGGTIVVPFLINFLHIPPIKAIGLSVVQMFFAATISTLLQGFLSGNVDMVLSFFLILSSVLGARLGAPLGASMSPFVLKIIAVFFYLLIAVGLLLNVFLPPSHPYSIAFPS